MKYDYAFIGAGNMAEAILRGLLKGGQNATRVLLSDTRTDRLEDLKSELGVAVTELNVDAAEAALIILSVKPQVISEVAGALAGKLSAANLVVSIAAGVTLSTLEKDLGGAAKVVRVMPNTPALVGEGASAYSLGSRADENDGKAVEALLKAFGIFVKVTEDKMDAVTALSGSGPAYVFLFMEALVEAGKSLELDDDIAYALACQTLKGGAAMLAAGSDDPAALRKKVTSPGGTTEAAIKTFEAGEFKTLVKKAMTAARDRGRELGKQ